MDDAVTSRRDPTTDRSRRVASLLSIHADGEARAVQSHLVADELADDITIEHASTFEAGLRKLGSKRYDVILLDLDLPDVDDLVGLGEICTRSPAPVIALSSVDDENHGLAAMHLGAHDYVIKGQLTATAIRRIVRYAIERGRWRAEQSRRERIQQHQLRLILSQFPGTLWTTDTSLRYTQSVGGDLSRLGVEEDEVVGRELGEYLGKPGGIAVQAHRRSLSGEVAEYDWRQAGRRWHAVTAPLLDDAGTVTGVVGVATDVTEKLAAAAALAEALEAQQVAAAELEELNRMKDTFLQGVSHELRTPLTSIIGFAQVLAGSNRVLSEEQLALFHTRLLANARRLEQLLDDLLDVDRLTHGRLDPIRTPTDLAGLITTVVEGRDDPPIEVTLDLEPVTLAVEASRVERIVDNLLRNVARHTPPDTQAWVRLRAAPPGATIIVDDDGPGIAPEDRLRLLSPFEQGSRATDAAQPGTGVGLALVATFARMHGGDVEITDSPAGGTRVVVTLAAGPSSPDAHPATDEAVAGLSSTRSSDV